MDFANHSFGVISMHFDQSSENDFSQADDPIPFNQSLRHTPVVTVADQSIGSEVKTASANKIIEDGHPDDLAVPPKSKESLAGLYFLLTTACLLFAAWFVGPRMVEEYHYAAARGNARS